MMRPAGSKRGPGGPALRDWLVISTVRTADPAVDVVAQLLPVPRGGVVDDLDGAQPLDGLVAVHGGHIEPYRAAVVVGDGLVLHGVGHDHVGTAGLGHGET